MAGTADAVPVFLLLAVLDTWQGILVVGESRECEMDLYIGESPEDEGVFDMQTVFGSKIF